jgi:hypothetical protein
MSDLDRLGGTSIRAKQSMLFFISESREYDPTSLQHPFGRRRSELRAPALVLLAVACILEAYAQLGAIGSPHYVRSSMGAGLFAAATLAAIALLNRSSSTLRDPASGDSLCAARALLTIATLVAIALPRVTSSGTLGVSDLLVALGVLVAAAVDEQTRAHRPRLLRDPENLRRSRPSFTPRRP